MEYEKSQIQQYVNYTKNFKIFTKEEEKEAFNQLRNGNLKMREEIILRNLRLVVSIVQRCKVGLPFFELLSYANQGLMYAVDNFNINTGTSFATYASHCIKGFIKSGINSNKSNMTLPQHFVIIQQKYNKLISEYYSINGTHPDDEYIIKELKINKETLNLLKLYSKEFINLDSFDNPIDDDECSLYDVIQNETEDNVNVQIENKILEEEIIAIIEESLITEKQKEVFIEYYKSDLKSGVITELAVKYNCSRQAIHDKIYKAAKKLKNDPKILKLCKDIKQQ